MAQFPNVQPGRWGNSAQERGQWCPMSRAPALGPESWGPASSIPDGGLRVQIGFLGRAPLYGVGLVIEVLLLGRQAVPADGAAVVPFEPLN